MSKKYKKKIDYKARLEHKLYLARENPEPVFDLTDCDLKQIPSGTFSLCRVFLKEALLLSNNRLENFSNGGSLSDLKLLKILDMQNNNLHTIPDDIKLLINLRELYLNNNHLKKLPESITLLYKLRNLDLANNSIQKLPETFGNLGSLKRLSLIGNKHLNKLPKSICGVRNLTELLLNADNFIYPPTDICNQSVENIIEYIANDCGIPYIASVPLEVDEEAQDAVDYFYNADTSDFQEKILQLEKVKEQRAQDFLKMERYNEMLQRQEFKLHDEKRADKQKLLQNLVEEQDKLDSELMKFQREKDKERQMLIQELQEEENKTEESINRLLEMSQKPQSQFLEYEAREDARLLEVVTKNNSQLCREEILKNMQTLLNDETEQFEKYSQNKNATMRTILSDEMEIQLHINQVLEKQAENQINLATQLEEDDKLQMVAVGALLERSDARSWSLTQQVNLVSSQLAKLTHLELDKRKLEIDAHMNDLSEKRVELSSVLLDLLSQQAERRNQLISNLRELQVAEGSNSDDFWLIQYQKLIDRRPEFVDTVQRNLDPELLQSMLMAGVIHCLPFLAPWAHSIQTLASLTDSDLLDAGIVRDIEREKILTVIHSYMKLHGDLIHITAPSAPLEEDKNEASAPSLEKISISSTFAINSVECVICMDQSCTVLYVPCGHLCTCADCTNSVEICPLCRGVIETRIQVIVS